MSEVAGDGHYSAIEGLMKYESIHRYTLSSEFVAGKNVLDIGAGEGYGSRILAQAATLVIAVDHDKDTVERAKRDYPAIRNLRFVQGSWIALPVRDHSIDVVISFDPIEYSRSHDELLVEIKRVLRPNGLLLFSTMNRTIVSSSSSKSYSPTVKSKNYAELMQLLRRHFSNVVCYAQRSNTASFIYPYDTGHDISRFQFVPLLQEIASPMNIYGMAVSFFITASNDVLPAPDQLVSVHSDLTTSPDGFALYTLMEQLSQLYAEWNASRQRIAAMQRSKLWKLRDAWFGVRDRRAWLATLVPPLQKLLWSLTFKHVTTRYPFPARNFITAALVPPLQKLLWGLSYNHFTTRLPSSAHTFMNLGYIGDADEPGPALESIDEPKRLQIQLYHHVSTLVDVAGREVLEVGCGRGGGAAYVKRYLGPASMVGLDLADKAVEFCRRTHRLEGLRFVQGDAERMPFDDRQFDIVINVESSHCYPDLNAFFREVKRVLRPRGYFLYADLLPSEKLPQRRRMLHRAGLKIMQERDITSNVLAALDSNTDQRVAFEATLATVFGRDGAREWAIVPGSVTLDGMRFGTLCYVSMALRAGQSSVTARP